VTDVAMAVQSQTGRIGVHGREQIRPIVCEVTPAANPVTKIMLV
jgi:hypothetical protein